MNGREVDVVHRRREAVLVERCDRAFELFGDTARGALWPSEADRRVRFDVMLDVIDAQPATPITLCDFGCGSGELLTHIRRRGLTNVTYIGADRSALVLARARAKFPDTRFVQIDVAELNANVGAIACDYLVANGVFTAKWDLTDAEMWAFFSSTIRRTWPYVRRGIAFNVMSKIVDWERDDLFHVPMDAVAGLLHELAGRNVRLRADYGLYEYTAYARRQAPASIVPREPAVVPVMRPQLPSTASLSRYLRRIDVSRVYTNHGPLVNELEERLSDLVRLPAGAVVTATSGTDALAGAILATAGRGTSARPFAILPAFTFVATAIAAELCGYRPYLVDVDAETWMLDPDALRSHPVLGEAGLVIPVAPFGRPVSQERWLAFQAATGTPVVFDGASSLDRIVASPQSYVGEIPVALSFHATKSFATGEGGGVATTNAGLANRVARALNFGFFEGRDSRGPSLNGKMSEYHAAVGLAELDGWAEKRMALERAAHMYASVDDQSAVLERLVTTPDVSSTYVLFHAAGPAEAAAVQGALRLDRIEFRQWYGGGVLEHPYFRDVRHDSLLVTERLGACLIGLPIAPDLTEETVARVTSALVRALERNV